jgi:hypothetical protein
VELLALLVKIKACRLSLTLGYYAAAKGRSIFPNTSLYHLSYPICTPMKILTPNIFEKKLFEASRVEWPWHHFRQKRVLFVRGLQAHSQFKDNCVKELVLSWKQQHMTRMPPNLFFLFRISGNNKS